MWPDHGGHRRSQDLGTQRRFDPGTDGSIPEQAIAAYNQTHPDRPY
jgi:hypothetical protein